MKVIQSLRALLLAATVFAISSTFAMAGEDGFYVGADLGAVQFQDSKVTDANKKFSGSGTFEFKGGFNVSGVAGYDFGNLRVETEASWRRSKIESVSAAGTFNSIERAGTPKGNATATGTLSSMSGMINGWYDVDTGTSWVPYVGGGAGIARITAKLDTLTYGGASLLRNGEKYDKTAVAPVYQLGAGVGYEVTEAITVHAGYRYFAKAPIFESKNAAKAEFGSHNLVFGVRHTF